MNPALEAALQRGLRAFAGQWQAALRAIGQRGGHQSRGGSRFAPRKQGSGPMLGSIPSRTQVTARGSTMLVAKNNHPAASYHQTGTRNMPARPPIELTRQDIKNLELKLNQAVRI